MTAEVTRVPSNWLDLREPADATARSTGLVERLRAALPRGQRLVVHDLGCGTGAMSRWLAPLLPGPQFWVEHDLDPDLLTLAAANSPQTSADGAAVNVEVRQSDITRLDPSVIAGADLVTASALLDLLTGDELTALVKVCLSPSCPILFTLSVVGCVELAPRDPDDPRVSAAFNAHQRRPRRGGHLLGPDAAAVAAQCFRDLGAEVIVRRSPWILNTTDPDQAALVEQWFSGWVGAAKEQQTLPDIDSYAQDRLAQLQAGALRVTVHHCDLLVLPAEPHRKTFGRSA
jgi:SAM-dependent methyltransferase